MVLIFSFHDISSIRTCSCSVDQKGEGCQRNQKFDFIRLSHSEKCSKVFVRPIIFALFCTDILMPVLYSVSEQVISIFNIFVNCLISLFNNLNFRKFGNCPYTCNFLFRYMTSFSLNLNLMQPLSLKPNFTFYRLIYELWKLF